MNNEANEPIAFTSLAVMRGDHARMLEARRGASENAAGLAAAGRFLQRGAALGAFLDEETDRVAAQALLDYWANALDRSGAPYEDAALSNFDSRSLIASAQAAYDSWAPGEQAMAGRVIQALSRSALPAPPEAPRYTFATAPRSALDAPGDTPEDTATLDRAIQKMIDAGWLAIRPGAEGQPAEVEVAQPALARHWPPMMNWLAEIRERLDMRNRLALAAQQWLALGKNPSALRRGALLDIALSFSDLGPLESEYVRESLEAERADAVARQAAQTRELDNTRQLAEELRKGAELESRRFMEVRRRNRALAGAAALLFLLLVAAILLAVNGYQQSRLALARQLAVESITSPNIDQALLLAVQAQQISDAAEEADSALFRAVNGVSPELSAILHGHAGEVWAVAFDPQNRDRFATGGEDRTVILWDAESRKPMAGIAPLKHERASVYALSFSPDGRRLAVGTGDGALTMWDVSGPAPAARSVITAHEGAIFSVAFDPADANVLLTGGQDRAVRLWDVRTDTPVLAFEAISHTGWVWGVAFSPDGTRAGSVGQGPSGNVFWWDVSAASRALTPRPAPAQHQQTVTSIAFAPDGKSAATGDTEGRIVVWGLPGLVPTELQTRDTDFGFVWGLAYSSNSGLLAAGGGQGSIRVWRASPLDRIALSRDRLLGHRDGVLRIAFSPKSGDPILVSGSFENRALVWNLGKPAFARTLGSGLDLSAGVLSPSGGAVTADRSGLQVWDAEGKPALPLPAAPAGLNGTVSALGMGGSGGALGVGYADGQIAFVGAAGVWRVMAASGEPVTVTALAVSRDGGQIAIARCSRFSAEGRCEESRITRRNTATGATAGPDIVTMAGWLWSMAYSADGKTLAAGVCARTKFGSCAQGEIRAWLLPGEPRELRATSTEHRREITSLSFSGDGKWLASGSEDRLISLWRVQGPGLYRPFSGSITRHNAGIASLAFDASGTRMLSLARDRTVAEWALDSAPLQRRACGVANRQLNREEWERLVPDQPYAPACP